MLKLPAVVFFMGLMSSVLADHPVWFGTAGNNAGVPPGIYEARLADDGKLTSSNLLIALNGAGWITRHPSKPGVIYATANLPKSSIVAVKDGKQLNTQSVSGGSCFLTPDKTGTLLLSAHYGAGCITVFPLNEDGTVGDQVQRIQHEGGSGIVGNRQNSPHPHYVAVSLDNRFVFVPDLGLDQLIAYRLDLEQKRLLPHASIDVEPGGGPRHMKFHPSGKFAFVLNELSLAVTLFRYNSESGQMIKVETVPALTMEEQQRNQSNSGSEIRVSDSGDYVYSANRGDDSISVFAFDERSATLTRIQVVPARASWPRNFNLSPDGKMLFVGGRDSNNVSVFSIGVDGRLTHRDHRSIFVPAPICILF